VVVQNVGHVPNYYTGARNYVQQMDSGPPPRISDADITIHPESKTGDRARLAALSGLGLKFAATSDVTIVCHNPTCVVEVLFSAHAGLLIVRVTKGGARPLIIMGVYLRPGIKSRDATIVTCNLIRSWHRLLSKNYPGELIIIGGDFNSSVISPSRYTCDTQNRGHFKTVASMLRDLQYSPLHGRSAAFPAHFTSRSAVEAREGRSEVDFIFGPSGLDASCFRLCENQLFDDIAGEGALTHVAIGVEFVVPRRPRNRLPQPSSAPERPKPPVVPDWDSLDQYAEAARVMREELESGRVLHAVGAAAKLQALRGIFAKARVGHLDTQTEQQAEVEADRAAPCRPLRRDRLVLYKGMRLPQHLAQLHERARAIRTAARRAKRCGYGCEAESLFAQFRAARGAARNATRTYWRTFQSSLFRRLEHARVHNSHALYRMIDGLCPLPGNGFSSFPPVSGAGSSAEREAEARQFLASFEAILCGNKPVPDAVSSAFWHQFLPRGVDGARLAVRPTWQEVMLVVFPVHRVMGDVSWHVCVGGGAACVLCSLERDKINCWDGSSDSPECEAPSLTPHLHSSVAAGPDGLPPEDLMWPRPRELGQRYAFRKLVSTNIADALGAVWDEGAVPQEFATYRTTPVPKSGKPGVQMDPRSPDDHRPITCGNVLAKVLGLIIARRLMHWAVAQPQPIISPSQVGFMPHKGAEEHVFSLLELAKSRWRVDSPMYALFVDLRKAYDMVHPAALWAVLRHMGVPDIIVSLLEDWSTKRITTMSRNGVASEPWHMSMGVGQGDVLSPLLFNFFIESLGRYVSSRPGYNGVTVGSVDGPGGSVTVKELKYADDICNPAESARELQVVLNATVEWCDAWGMQLGLGGKKTEAVAFIPPRLRRAHPPLPLLSVKGVEVHWVSEYRYLGYIARDDLRDDGALTAMATKLSGQWQRYFNTTGTILKHSPAFALQVFKTTVSGSTNFLLAFANPGQKGAADVLDAVSLRAARKALRLSDRNGDMACNAIVWGESRLPRGAAILARERTRFALKMRLSPFAASDIAPRIFRALSASVDNDQLPLSHNAKSITHRIILLERAASRDGSVPAALLQQTTYRDIAKTAAIVSRRVGVHLWRDEACAALAAKPLPPAADVLRPPSSESGVAAYLNDFYRTPLSAVGSNKYTTVLAVRGPGCCGGLLSQVSRMDNIACKLRALAAVRRGRKGMFDAPLAVPGRTFAECMEAATTDAREFGLDAFEGERSRARRLGDERRMESSLRIPCSICNEHVEDPYHVLVECPEPATVAARAVFQQGVPEHVERIVRLLVLPRHVVDRLSFRHDFYELNRREELVQQIRKLADDTDWSSADGRFVLFHLLAVATWTHRPCRADMPLSRALAGVFESNTFELKNHHVRPLVNGWANWGAAGVLDIFAAWNAVAAPRVAAAFVAAKPERAARSAAAIARAVAVFPRAAQRRRLPRPVGSRLPAWLNGCVVDLTA
jgi:hypothetical protein